LPRIRIVHDLDEVDKHCTCEAELKPMGEEVNEQYDVDPPRFRLSLSMGNSQRGVLPMENPASSPNSPRLAPRNQEITGFSRDS
jgi:hypothetical protein